MGWVRAYLYRKKSCSGNYAAVCLAILYVSRGSLLWIANGKHTPDGVIFDTITIEALHPGNINAPLKRAAGWQRFS